MTRIPVGYGRGSAAALIHTGIEGNEKFLVNEYTARTALGQPMTKRITQNLKINGPLDVGDGLFINVANSQSLKNTSSPFKRNFSVKWRPFKRMNMIRAYCIRPF